MNTEHQLKSKLAWPDINDTWAMTAAKNEVFIGLYFENYFLLGEN